MGRAWDPVAGDLRPGAKRFAMQLAKGGPRCAEKLQNGITHFRVRMVIHPLVSDEEFDSNQPLLFNWH